MTFRTTSAGNVTSDVGRRSESVRQISRFLVIGCTSVVIDFVVYALLTRARLSPPLAKGLSYLAGMLFGFLGNKFWTFESSRKSTSEPITYILLYAATLGVNVAINSGVLALFADAKLFAFLVATGVTTVLNFLGMRWITFREGVRQRLETEGTLR
jgi:putative flippase GtrA